MSASRGKADIRDIHHQCLLLTQSGLQPIAPRELKNTPVPRQSVVASPPLCRGEHGQRLAGGTNVAQVGLCFHKLRRPNRWRIANIAVIRLKLGVSGRIGASAYIAHAPLPILPQPTLHPLTSRKDDAVAEAKQSIDRILLDSSFTQRSTAFRFRVRRHGIEPRSRRRQNLP